MSTENNKTTSSEEQATAVGQASEDIQDLITNDTYQCCESHSDQSLESAGVPPAAIERKIDSNSPNSDFLELWEAIRGSRPNLGTVCMLVPQMDGVYNLNGGDTLVLNGNQQILFMLNGDRLIVQANGSYDLKADGLVSIKKDSERTNISYLNGDCVTLGRCGIESITREAHKTIVAAEMPVANNDKVHEQTNKSDTGSRNFHELQGPDLSDPAWTPVAGGVYNQSTGEFIRVGNEPKAILSQGNSRDMPANKRSK
jgi:hypothetical protein